MGRRSNSRTATAGSSAVPVLPEKPSITKVGGPGNEFLVGGIHYAVGPNASSGRKAQLHYGELPGAWRVEESPSEPAAEDYFLNVLAMTDRQSDAMPKAEVLADTAASVALRVTAPSGKVTKVTFAKGDVPGATIKVTDSGKVLFDGAMPDRVVLEDGRPQPKITGERCKQRRGREKSRPLVLVRPAGLEPATFGFEAHYSIH